MVSHFLNCEKIEDQIENNIQHQTSLILKPYFWGAFLSK
jgi:hypothetical protein